MTEYRYYVEMRHPLYHGPGEAPKQTIEREWFVDGDDAQASATFKREMHPRSEVAVCFPSQPLTVGKP
jgi:hypothetical protein